jgi:hypothetical protein
MKNRLQAASTRKRVEQHAMVLTQVLLYCRDKCLALAGCLYCKNKFSPMLGSDGVCLSADQAKLLPKTGYECESSAPQQKQQQQQQRMEASAGLQAADDKQPSGGDDNCGKLREK